MNIELGGKNISLIGSSYGSDRTRMRQYIERYLMSRTSADRLPQCKHRFPSMAARLEQLLYTEAASIEEYMNLRTLHDRLRSIASCAPMSRARRELQPRRVITPVETVSVNKTASPDDPVFVCVNEPSSSLQSPSSQYMVKNISNSPIEMRPAKRPREESGAPVFTVKSHRSDTTGICL